MHKTRYGGRRVEPGQKKVKVAQLCPTLCHPIDYTVHGILQARILEWVVFLLQGIFPTQGSNLGLPHCRRALYQLSYQGSPVESEYLFISRAIILSTTSTGSPTRRSCCFFSIKKILLSYNIHSEKYTYPKHTAGKLLWPSQFQVINTQITRQDY